MSFLGSGFVVNHNASFYQPEATGVNASRWSRFPAIEEVDMDGNDILNINNLTINGEVDLENLVLTDLTVENDVSVGRDLRANRSILLPNELNIIDKKLQFYGGDTNTAMEIDGSTP